MKRIILYFALATAASGQVVNITNQQERSALPTASVTMNGLTYPNPSFAQLKTLGWRYQNTISNAPLGYIALSRTWVDAGGTFATAIMTTRTTNEQAQIDASNAVANAAAIAAMPPPEFPRGIALPDVLMTNPVYGVVCDGGDLVTFVTHASPYDPAVAASNRTAAIAARKQIKTDLKAIKGSVATNIANVQGVASLTNGYTANEARAAVNSLRSELIDALRDVQDLRKAQADALKETAP